VKDLKKKVIKTGESRCNEQNQRNGKEKEMQIKKKAKKERNLKVV
jgi:hypothetical protein